VLHALALCVRDIAEIKDALRRHKLMGPETTESGLVIAK